MSFIANRQGWRHGTTIGGGRRSFEVDSFHATSIGIMLNAEKFAGDWSPPVPLVPSPMRIVSVLSPFYKSGSIRTAIYAMFVGSHVATG